MFIGFDIETTGSLPEYALQPWRVPQGKAWIRTYAIAADSGNYLELEPTQDTLRQVLLDWVENKTVVCVWNALFELSWLCAYGLYDLVRKIKWLDGMLLLKHSHTVPVYDEHGEIPSYGLKDAVAKYLPHFAGYEDGIDFHGDDILSLGVYNVIDAVSTLEITKQIYNELRQSNPKGLRAALIEASNLPTFALANYLGVTIDRVEVEELGKALDREAQSALEELSQHGASPDVLASPKQLSALLFESWQLRPVKYSEKTGLPSTDKETLVRLAEEDTRAGLVKKYRDAVGNKKKFVDNILVAADYNDAPDKDVVYPQAIVYGTYSGRLTYASAQGKNKNRRQIGWAIHQMKRDSAYRKGVKAPDGHVIVEFDAAAQEYRWMAVMSGDPIMLSLCMPGEDPHTYMAAQIAGLDYNELRSRVEEGDKEAKNYRQLGKIANLSCQYRTSANKLRTVAYVQFGVKLTPEQAAHIHAVYRRTYQFVPLYWQRQIDIIKHQLYVDNLAGRRVYVSGRDVALFSWSVESTAINFPIQSIGADQKHLALFLTADVVEQFGARFLFDLHDGIYFVVEQGLADQFIAEMLNILNNLPYKTAWGADISIPMPFDCKVGPSWGSLKEIK